MKVFATLFLLACSVQSFVPSARSFVRNTSVKAVDDKVRTPLGPSILWHAPSARGPSYDVIESYRDGRFC